MLKPIEQVYREVGTVEDVLNRHGYETGRGMRCPNPSHDDRHPGSVKILPSHRHPGGRIYCFSCGMNENAIGLARLLGERVQFATADKPGSIRRFLDWRPPRTPKQIITRTRLLKELSDDPTVETDWAAAKLLARLGNRQAVQKEILRNYDYLSQFNLPRIWALVQGIWDYGSKVYGLPRSDPRSWKAWVDKVSRELER